MGLFSSLFGSKEKSTSSIPKYLERASSDVINRAKGLIDKDTYKGYTGPMVAGKNSYYDKAAGAMNNQRGLASQNFSQANRLLDSIKRPTTNYYGGAESALNQMRPLSGDYFSGAQNFLGGIDRGASTYGAVNSGLNRGDADFRSAMGRANSEIGQMAARGGETNRAIGEFGQLPGLVRGSQGRAEGLQLGTNQDIRSTLGGAMGRSGLGYDEASDLTRRASALDATNFGAIDARMNPYSSAVTDNILRDYGKQRRIGGNQLNDQARAAGAFGGSRHGVAQGMYDQETSKGINDILTAQREKGYNQAVGQLNADRNNLLTSAGQLSNIQGARDQGTLGFTGQISGTAQSDANLLRQGGLDVAGATKDAASGRMGAEQQLFGMDQATANMLASLGKGYSDQSMALANARLGAQGQRFGQDMNYADRLEALGKDRMAQQAQQFGQGMDIVNARDALAKGRLGQEQQRYNMDLGLADAQSRLGQADQQSWQAYAADLLGYGKELRGITQADYDARKALFDEKQQYPYEQLNFLSSIIGGQPYSRATTSTKSDGIGNSLLSALSTGVGAFLSDETKKENRSEADVEKILDEFRKMPVDDYDYKKSAVATHGVPEGRRTGPMAQDWQKAFGGNGHEIDVAQMLGKLAGAVKGLEERTRSEGEQRRTLPRRKAA